MKNEMVIRASFIGTNNNLDVIFSAPLGSNDSVVWEMAVKEMNKQHGTKNVTCWEIML